MKGFTKGKGSGKKFIPTTNKKKGLKKSDILGHGHSEDSVGRTLPPTRRKESLDKENLFENLSKKRQNEVILDATRDMGSDWTKHERVGGVIDTIYSNYHSKIPQDDLYNQIDKIVNKRKKEHLDASNLPKRKLTQEELQNIEIEVTDVQMENQKILERDVAKAKARGDTRNIWEIREDQVNYNHKQVELWDSFDDATKTKLLKDNGIEDDKIKENINKSFMDLGKQDGYPNSDFRKYLSSEINGYVGIPTEWYDK